MARPQKFRHSREALTDPQIAEKLGRLVMDIEALRQKRQQIDEQIAAAYDTVDESGFEKKFVRKVVSLRAKEAGARRDEEDGLEAYEFAIEKGVSLACARRERNIPPHDPATGEIVETQESGGSAIGAVKAQGRLPDAVGVEPLPSDPKESEIAPDRNEPVTVDTPPAPTGSASDEMPEPFQPPAFLTKPRTAADYRPNCLNPDACAAGVLDHCYGCRKAMAEEAA